jgi:hypothetical protein
MSNISNNTFVYLRKYLEKYAEPGRSIVVSRDQPYGPGNIEFEVRWLASLRNEHAPGDLCRCHRCPETGYLGTAIMSVDNDFSIVAEFRPFERLTLLEKRLSCLGMKEDVYGTWCTDDGISLQEYVQKEDARSRLCKWARSVRARPYVLHWMEHCAKAQEQRRIAEVTNKARSGIAYDPLFE